MRAACIATFSTFLLFQTSPAIGLRFEVTNRLAPASGRLLVILAKSERPDPRNTIGDAGPNASTILGRDVKNLGVNAAATIDKTAAFFPIQSMDGLRAGEYYVQALLASNRDLKSPNAPDNLYSDILHVHLDPRSRNTVRLELTKSIPPEEPPPEKEFVKYIKIQSDLLSRFHGRPIYLRAGIILPKDYAADENRRYPLRVHIGGY